MLGGFPALQKIHRPGALQGLREDTMSRPSVLVVEPDAARRKEVSTGLAGFGYEVVPAVGAEEGRRYAASLGPGLVVAPAGLARGADGVITERFASADPTAGQTLLLLGRTDDEGRDLPEDVLFLKAEGLPAEDLVRRIQLVLLGREMGVEPDADLESLVGDLELLPFLELLRATQRARLTGRIVCAGGDVALENGEVTAASAGRTRGIKAFLRLSQLGAGPFWVRLRQAAGAEREIQQDLTSLIFLALEDRVHGAPDPRARARVQLGPNFYETRFTPRQQELLAALPAC